MFHGMDEYFCVRSHFHDFCSTIDYPEDADAMNIMSFGYLGCSGETLRIADIDNNDLRVHCHCHPNNLLTFSFLCLSFQPASWLFFPPVVAKSWIFKLLFPPASCFKLHTS